MSSDFLGIQAGDATIRVSDVCEIIRKAAESATEKVENRWAGEFLLLDESVLKHELQKRLTEECT